MTGDVIKEFLVGLGFDIDEAGMASFTEALQSASLKAAALGAAALAAGSAVFAAVQHIAGEYDQLDKLATRFRTTAAAVDEFSDIGKILGLSEEQTIGGLESLDRAIGDTALGLGRAKAVFEEIGLTVLDAGGKMRPTTQVMDELAAKLKDMERGKAIAVMERLGLDPALLKVFNADLESLRVELEDIDKAAGFDISEAVDESKQFTRSWRSLTQEFQKGKMVFDKLVDSLAVRLMPRFRASLDTLKKHLEGFRKMVMDNMEQIRGTIATAVDVLLRVVGFVSASGYRLIQVVSFIVNGIMGLFSKLTPGQQKIVLGIGAIIAAWKFLNLSFLKTPLGQILMLVAAIGLLVDDFLIWRDGGDSLIDWGSTFGKTLQAVTAFVAFATTAFLVGKGAMLAYGAAVTFVNGVVKAAQGVMAAFNLVMAANPATLMIAGIVAAIALLATAAYMIWDHWQPIQAWFTGFFSWLQGKFGAAGQWISDLMPNGVIEHWETLKNWFAEFFSWLDGKFGAAVQWISRLTPAWLKELTSSTDASVERAAGGSGLAPAWMPAHDALRGLEQPLTMPHATLTPSPSAAATMTGGQQNLNQKTEIVVQGSPDADATARSVAREQTRVNADLARNMRGVVR